MTAAALSAPRRLPALGVAGWIALAAALGLAAVFLLDPRVLNDPDTYWHLAAGGWILDHLRVPHVDPFSFTHAGRPWIAHEWLSEVLMALAFRGAGWSGLAVLFAVSASASAVLWARRLSLSLSGLGLATAVFMGLAIGAGSLLARPHVLILPVLLVWTLAILRARDGDRAPPLAWAALMTLWANLHGSYVFGFLVAAALALEALTQATPERRWPVIRGWGAFGLTSLAAATLTPHGPAGLIYPFYIMTLQSTERIGEWAPADLTALGPLTLAIFLTLFVGFSRGLRVPPVRLLLVLLLLFMALQHARHALILGLVAPLLLADPLARALGQGPARPASLRVVWTVAAVLLTAGALRLALPVTRSDSLNTPGRALAAAPAELIRRPVLNEYGFGGYLIFRGVRPFIDGRADMYGDAHFNRYMAATDGDDRALDAILAEHAIAWTLFPASHPIVRRLDARPGWRRLHADDAAVVHVRRPVAPPS